MPKVSKATTSTRVADYMSAGAYSIRPEDSLATAAELMQRHDIRHLPVMSDHELVGVISQRDLQVLRQAGALEGESSPVGDFMWQDVYTVTPNTSIAHVAQDLLDRKIGSAVVVERGEVVGMFTLVDALRALADLARPSGAEIA